MKCHWQWQCCFTSAGFIGVESLISCTFGIHVFYIFWSNNESGFWTKLAYSTLIGLAVLTYYWINWLEWPCCQYRACTMHGCSWLPQHSSPWLEAGYELPWFDQYEGHMCFWYVFTSFTMGSYLCMFWAVTSQRRGPKSHSHGLLQRELSLS